MKKGLFATFMLMSIMGIFAPAVLNANEVKVIINGEPVSFEGQVPVIIDGRMLVPVGEVFRHLDFEVSWDGDTGQAVLVSPDYHIIITIGSDIFLVNGEQHTLDVPAQIIGGRSMLPIRAVLESAGIDVGWDAAANAVVITYDAPDRVYVRDDGVRFSHGQFGLNVDTGQGILTMNSLSDWPTKHRIFNEELQANGFEPMDNAIVVWAFLDGPHPSEGAQFLIEEVPQWFYAEYKNQNPHSAASNGNFSIIYEDFIRTVAQPNASNDFSQYWEGFEDGSHQWPIWPEIDIMLDQEARKALQSGFANDDVRHMFPFSPDFFNKHTAQIENHFWARQDKDFFWGVYNGRGQIGIGISSDDSLWSGEYAHAAAHELAHSFGLSEHLSHFFDEVMMGWTPQDGRPSSSGSGGLYRTSAMDRVLMDLAGPVAFWEAVFWSEESYTRLWEQHLGHFVPYETMQLARAGHEAALRNAHLQQSFMYVTSQENGRELTSHTSTAFLNAFDPSLTQTERDTFAQIAQQEIKSIALWAKQQGIRPYRSHFRGYMPLRIVVTPL